MPAHIYGSEAAYDDECRRLVTLQLLTAEWQRFRDRLAQAIRDPDLAADINGRDALGTLDDWAGDYIKPALDKLDERTREHEALVNGRPDWLAWQG